MRVEISAGKPVDYFIHFGESQIHINQLIGQKIQLKFEGEIRCTHCGRSTKKSFSNGFCFPCSQKLAQCDSCVLQPENCHYAKGTCREPKWGEEHCMIPHFVYLANSSGLKVGITRHTQIPTRWVDQGAIQALPVFKVTTRYQSGLVEALFRDEVSDKTNWRAMLKQDVEHLDLCEERDRLVEAVGEGLDSLEEEFGREIEYLENSVVTEIQYPVLKYSQKLTAFTFNNGRELVEGTLQGIKGQYLIFEDGVINIRRHTGYKVSLLN